MKRRVLVVDDEPAILVTLEMAFDEAGLEMRSAASAEDAIERLKGGPFDAVLIDKNLPGKSGLDLVRWIRERNRGVPLVVMTGYASPESAREALNLGIDSYIEKPFPSVMEVPELLGELVGSGRPGWLPGQADVPIALPVAGARATRVLVAAANASASELREPALGAAPAGSTVEVHETLDEVLLALHAPPRPDLVIVDAGHFPEVVRAVESIRQRSEFVSIAVVTASAPTLGVLQELILLGVTQILERRRDAYEAQVARVIRSLG